MTGIWRVSRGPDPLSIRSAPLDFSDLNTPGAGNRFDSPVGAYSVLYFATKQEGCFGETLVRMRPNPALVELVRRDWDEQGFMDPAAVPADWRTRRLAVRVSPQKSARFLDVEHPATHRFLERELAPLLALWDISELDVSVIRGADRRITRWISFWAWQAMTPTGRPRFAGIRYVSRLNSDWECWALFDRARLEELEREPIHKSNSALRAVAKHFDLTVH